MSAAKNDDELDKDCFVLYGKLPVGDCDDPIEMYAKIKHCKNIDEAVKFAFREMPAVAVLRQPLDDDNKGYVKNPQKPYAVAAKKEFPLYFMGESDGYGSNYAVVKSSVQDLERSINMMYSSKDAKKVLVGLELKIV